MIAAFLDYISQVWNDYVNSERQEKIISVQIVLICTLFVLIYLCYHKHKTSIFELNNFIEQGQNLNQKNFYAEQVIQGRSREEEEQEKDKDK